MKPTGKFLTVVFLVLFVILLVEAVYISRSFMQPRNEQANAPVPTLTIEQAEKISDSTLNVDQAIPQESIKAMQKANRGVLIASTMHNLYQGTVTEYTRDGDGLKIAIAGITGESNAFFYTPSQLLKVSFYKKSGNAAPIAIKDTEIKVGDLVRIEGDLDLLKTTEESFISDAITLILQ